MPLFLYREYGTRKPETDQSKRRGFRNSHAPVAVRDYNNGRVNAVR